MGSDKSNRGKGRRRSSRINRRPSPCALRGRFGRPSPCALCGRFGLTVTWCVRPLVFIRFWHGEDSGTGQVRAIRFTIYDLRLVRGHPQGPESIHRQQTGGIDTPAENDYTPTFRVQPPTPANYGVLVGRETIALTPIEKYAATTPHIDTPKKYKKPKSGSDKKQKNTRSKYHRLP